LDKKKVGAWALFDFANSVYPAVIVSVVFQKYYIEAVVGNEVGRGDFWWTSAVATSALIVALSAPVLGAVADRAGARKRFLMAYTAVCIIGVLLMTTLGPGAVIAGFAIFVLANVGFEGSLVFYNAYLPEIAPVEKQGRVSGLGFGVGYVASILGLLLTLGPAQAEQFTTVWLIVAGFFAVFAVPTFAFLPKDEKGAMTIWQAVAWGLRSFKQLWAEVMKERELRRFLLAYFLYIDGVLTAIYTATTLASSTFGYTTQELVYLFIGIQVTALIGAFVLAKPTDTIGPKKVLTGVLIIWVVAALSIAFIESKAAFAIVGMVAGFGLGAAQSVSRAFMSSLIPKGKESAMFGFYALCGKSSSVVGPLIFGQVVLRSGGNQRLAVMAISVLFIIGLILLQRVNDPKGTPAAA
jgi:UMF1 family MFS transporter